MMMLPQSHRIHLIVRIAAKQALVRVKILCRKCNNLVVVMMMWQGHNHQQVGIPLRMIRNKMLHVILLFGTNLQLLSHPTFPLMTTSHANLQLQCLQHYRKLIPSKFSFQKVCVYLLPSVQMKELTCITSKKCYDSPYRRRRRDDSFRGYVCNVLQPTT